MTADPGLRARYPDLLAEGDESIGPIVEDLDAALARGDPPAPLAVAISRRAAAPAAATGEAGTRLLRRLTPPRLSAPFAALLAVLLVAASALGVALANRALQADPGAKSVAEQMVAVDQTRVASGYSVTIQRAYADANRLILVYAVTPPAGEKDDAAAVVAATATAGDRTSLAWSDSIIENVAAGTGDGLISFDTAGVAGEPAVLDVHLVVKQLYIVGPNNPKGDPHGPKALFVSVPFDFQVPFHPGRSNHPDVSASFRGRPATVERVVETASETRVYIKMTGVNPTWAELRGSTGPAVRLSTLHNTDDGVVLIFSSPPQTGGTWRLIVGEKPLPNGSLEPGTPFWTFTFQAP